MGAGTLLLGYDGAPSRLSKGSCAHFDAERPHRLRAEGLATEVLAVAAHRPKGLWALSAGSVARD